MSAPPRRKRFGQHFLHDPRVLERIVAAIAPAPGDAMVEIGPGHGALTRPLLERLDRMDAVEIDRDLAAALGEAFPPGRLTLHVGDALAFDFSTLPERLRVVGNLPYNISTPLLFHLAEFAGRVRDMHFMLQLEVVERMAARHSSAAYGRLSVMLQTRFRVEKLFTVSRGAFEPPPKVDSAIVRLVPLAASPLEGIDPALFRRVVTGAFTARRKQLRNALPLAPADYAALGLDPTLRPENLSPDDYVRITRHLASAGNGLVSNRYVT
ncbi:MAG TPA: 16S rRNA (adenine(1518)-N(6)/adenine(1519)-N(6))-dimethyltransferase RsmA, partial [Burkholderiales bacterium]